MAEYSPLDINTVNIPGSEYTSSGEFVGYVTAHDEDSKPIGELTTHGSNRWTHQGYFNDVPEITKDNDLQTSYSIHLTESVFTVNYIGLDSDQNYIDIEQLEPDDNDGVEYSISLAGSFPGVPLSAGTTMVDIDTTQVDDDDFDRTEWTYDYPGHGKRLPSSQEDSIGVRYSVEAEDTPGTYTLSNFQSHSWEVKRASIGGTSTVYSTLTNSFYSHDVKIEDS